MSPHELSPILTVLAEEKANFSHIISVFRVHVASQPCACKYSFPDGFFSGFSFKSLHYIKQNAALQKL